MRRLYIFPLCLLLSFCACEGDTAARRLARGDNFVSDPDHLYFQNVRSRDYRAERVAEGVDAYYHDELPKHSLVIVDRWLEDLADLRLRDSLLNPTEARDLRRRLTTTAKVPPFTDDPSRAAATEVVNDYLRMVGG